MESIEAELGAFIAAAASLNKKATASRPSALRIREGLATSTQRAKRAIPEGERAPKALKPLYLYLFTSIIFTVYSCLFYILLYITGASNCEKVSGKVKAELLREDPRFAKDENT